MKTKLYGAVIFFLTIACALTAWPAQAQINAQAGPQSIKGMSPEAIAALMAQLTPRLGHQALPNTPEEQAHLEQQSRMCQAAVIALHAGDYAQAQADARQALAMGDWSGLGQQVLAGALDGQGRTQEALQEYGLIVRQGDEHPRNLLPYALLLLETGHWAQAVAAYDKALPLLPGDNTGSSPSAVVQFSPDVPEPVALAAAIHVARGLVYNASSDCAHRSQDDLALAEYGKALQLMPDWDVANFYYGYGLQRLGRNTRASAAFQKTVKMAKGGVKAAAEQALKKLNKPT